MDQHLLCLALKIKNFIIGNLIKDPVVLIRKARAVVPAQGDCGVYTVQQLFRRDGLNLKIQGPEVK